jgi:hypothetical protein
VAQLVECLPSKHKGLNSNPITPIITMAIVIILNPNPIPPMMMMIK